MDDSFYLRSGDDVRRVDVLEWARDIGSQRVVKQTKLGDTLISTCFFGTNCGTAESPIFFETMVFSPNGTTGYKFRRVVDALKKHNDLVTMQTTKTTKETRDSVMQALE